MKANTKILLFLSHIVFCLLFGQCNTIVKSTPIGMRFIFDYDNVKSNSAFNISHIAWAISNVSTYINTIMKVYPYSFTIPSTTIVCDGFTLPSNVSATYTDIDMIISVHVEDTGIYPAKGVSCYYDSANINRPVVGRLILNKTL